MQVCYRGSPVGRETVYEQVGELAFCCGEMSERWGLLISFGVKWHRRSTDRAVNLYNVILQASGSPLLGLTPIHHCPFCGEPIKPCRKK